MKEKVSSPMNRLFARTAAVLLSLCVTSAMAPAVFAEPIAADISAASVTADAVSYRPVSYLDSAVLTAWVQAVMNGDCGLYKEENGTKVPVSIAVNAYLDNKQMYFARTRSGVFSGYGYQCYIYAQAVYAQLFDEIVYHGPSSSYVLKHSTQVMGASPVLTYSMLRDAHVMPGAYLRTTANTDGSYNSSYGHSLIILGYDENGITILEGNANGSGLVRCYTTTYDLFNSGYLNARYICHVVQPNDLYYQQNFGLSWNMYANAVVTTTTAPQTTTTVTTTTTPAPPETWEAPELDLHRVGLHYQLDVPGETALTWESSDETVAEVDADGTVTPLRDGCAVITAAGSTRSYDFELNIEGADWETAGDLDSDGDVTPLDAMQALQLFADIQLADIADTDTETLLIGDLDDDGEIMATDAQRILRYYAERVFQYSEDSAEDLWLSILNN